jgi:hypothetical protein
VDLEAARDAGIGRLDVLAGAQDAPPAEGVDDQRRAEVAAVGVDRLAGAAAHRSDLEAGIGLLVERVAEVLVVEARPAPG